MPDYAQVPASHHGSSGRGSTPPDTAASTLMVVKDHPLNAEAPLQALRELYTANQHFYVRSHLDEPDLVPQDWLLHVEGAVTHPFELSLDALRVLPSRTISATLECAGNDRIGLAPLPKGEPWGSGAVSTGLWRGVSLSSVLQRTGLRPSVVEVRFDGADRGKPEGVDEEMAFARALPLAKALDPDTLLAYELNGAPLPPEHGGPVRLVVPDWYGMASVKWLQWIAALEQPFDGYFQTTSYVLERPGDASALLPKEPLRTMRVKSLITSPAAGDAVPLGRQQISGVAWSGAGAIVKVEISVEGEGEWQPARLLGDAVPHAWRQWAWD